MNITYIRTHIQNMVTIHMAPTIYHHMDNHYRLRTLNAIIPKKFKKNWTYIHYPNCEKQVLGFIGCQLLIIQMTHSYTWHVFEFLCDGLHNLLVNCHFILFHLVEFISLEIQKVVTIDVQLFILNVTLQNQNMFFLWDLCKFG